MADDLDIWFHSLSPEEKVAVQKKAKTRDTFDLAPDDTETYSDTLEESTQSLGGAESTTVRHEETDTVQVLDDEVCSSRSNCWTESYLIFTMDDGSFWLTDDVIEQGDVFEFSAE